MLLSVTSVNETVADSSLLTTSDDTAYVAAESTAPELAVMSMASTTANANSLGIWITPDRLSCPAPPISVDQIVPCSI